MKFDIDGTKPVKGLFITKPEDWPSGALLYTETFDPPISASTDEEFAKLIQERRNETH